MFDLLSLDLLFPLSSGSELEHVIFSLFQWKRELEKKKMIAICEISFRRFRAKSWRMKFSLFFPPPSSVYCFFLIYLLGSFIEWWNMMSTLWQERSFGGRRDSDVMQCHTRWDWRLFYWKINKLGWKLRRPSQDYMTFILFLSSSRLSANSFIRHLLNLIPFDGILDEMMMELRPC